ncbi:MAG: hypothetical protein A2X79_01310 [Desulfuromonadaceae bacterium GWB2_53_15]|nr:MAG: hypothetical protein A2X83_10560 [Desulfuromonadales bacterium GWD2_54_10]OHB25758.1 MAG: hypothetical protein A2X79_01310 [Desulfuromonadaceae bacterium GWB2_53_15]
MNISYLIVAFLLLLSCGCGTVKVLPEQVDTGIINVADNSQTISKNGIEIRASFSDTAINAYNLEGTVTAFQLAITNASTNEVAFADDSFVLVDERGLQYSFLSPDKVREFIKKDSYYLMPYPYVGFYYLEDFQKTSFYNRFNSSLPYYYELYPQDLFTKSLPLTSIIPGMKVEGLVYFKIDLTLHQQVKLYVYRKGVSKTAPPEFIFPYKIVK